MRRQTMTEVFNAQRPTLMLVKWVDSHCNNGWITRDEVDDLPTVVWTVGWLVKETEHVLVIAPHWQQGGEEQLADPYTIPIKAILLRDQLPSTLHGPLMSERCAVEYGKESICQPRQSK